MHRGHLKGEELLTLLDWRMSKMTCTVEVSLRDRAGHDTDNRTLGIIIMYGNIIPNQLLIYTVNKSTLEKGKGEL